MLQRRAAGLAAILALLTLGACTTTTTVDPNTGAITEEQQVDMARVRAVSDALVTTLHEFAVMVQNQPDFNEAKKADLSKALAALDAAHGVVKFLPDGDITAGKVLSALVTAAIPVINVLPLDENQKSRAMLGLAGVRILIPLIGAAPSR